MAASSSKRVQHVLSLVAELSVAERAEVAAEVLASFDAGEPDPDHESAWQAEIEGRLASIDRGDVKLVPMDEALARIRARVAR
jgi:putative addiction module component (TIGR02574 family)